MTESEAYIALNLVPGMGAVTVRAGIAAFGSAAAFFSAGAAALANVPGIGRRRAEDFAAAAATIDWRGEIEKARACSLRLVTPADPDYPPLLRTIHSPPLCLYVAGSVECLASQGIAIVGTRAPTVYGRENAKNFAYRLAQAGFCVVSGLARGVDTEAAKGALLAKGRTVAVIGSALDRLYPTENRDLAREIVASGGAVVSEYPFGREADRQTFPMRNRIVSGLSLGVLCIEAGVSSGTLITADHALEQGRPVMAIPGRISDPAAQGCHKLIKNGARLVESPEDVVDEIQSLPLGGAVPHPATATPAPKPSAPKPAAGTFSRDEQSILSALREGECSPDALLAATGLSAGAMGPLLIALEMKCAIKRLPGGEYALR